MKEIRRSHVLDLQSRLRGTFGNNTLNKVIDTVKTVLAEAYFREDIDRDPGSRIGHIKYPRKEPGVFTVEELRMLFGDRQIWRDEADYTCFILAATTGMRKSEILALKWRSIDWEQEYVRVEEAWKNNTEIGPVTSHIILSDFLILSWTV